MHSPDPCCVKHSQEGDRRPCVTHLIQQLKSAGRGSLVGGTVERMFVSLSGDR